MSIFEIPVGIGFLFGLKSTSQSFPQELMVKRLFCKLWSVYIDIETSVVCKRWMGDNDSTNRAVASMLVHSDVRPMITTRCW